MQRASFFYFAALLGLALLAFWPTYFFPRRYELDWHVHLHGVAMFLWTVLLVTQAGLVRRGRRDLHRRFGKLSYALVPLIVVSTLLLARHRFATQGATGELLYFLAVQLGLLVAFVASYALAMANRRAPPVHARYMVCAALPLIDPILARVLAVHAAMGAPALQVVTYGVTDAILVALLARDRGHPRAPRIYGGMLALFVATQLPTFVVPAWPAWRAFGEAFARLPLP